MKTLALLLLLAAPCLAAKPHTTWTPREPEYLRTSKGAIVSAGKDSAGYWVIVDPLLFFKADDLRRERMVGYAFRSIVPEKLHERVQMRVMQEKNDSEFGPRIGTYSHKLKLKLLVSEAVVVKPPKPAKPQAEWSRWGND
jgi:hypothetical protein